MLDVTMVPEVVLEDLEQRWDLDKDSNEFKNKLSQMSAKEVFNEYLEWNGIVGFTDTIWDAAYELRQAEIQGRYSEEIYPAAQKCDVCGADLNLKYCVVCQK